MAGYNQTARNRALYEAHSKARSYLSGSPIYSPVYYNRGSNSKSDSLAERVFGRQLEEKRLWTAHFENTLGERNQIYHRQMKDLQEEISDLKGRLYSLAQPYSLHPPQVRTQLEKLLWQTESEQRKEQVRFWKDLLDIKDRMIQTSIEYRQTQDRSSLLEQPEEEYHG